MNEKTRVAFEGTMTWHVTLRTGAYRLVCDPHRTIMKGRFTVSNI
ncbi:MAG TPA: hypothetical protein VF186_03970 [Gaiellaceae bacterium]